MEMGIPQQKSLKDPLVGKEPKVKSMELVEETEAKQYAWRAKDQGKSEKRST